VTFQDPLPAADLERLRGRFPILANSTYLANHTLGAMPDDYAAALVQYTEEFATRGVRAWTEKGWWDSPVSVGDVLAPLLGAPSGSVVMLPNVTVAEWVVASCFDWTGPRRKVVYEAQNFPTVMYVWEAVAGAEVVTVPHSDDLIDAIDEQTLLVPISHVQFKTAHMVDVEAIVRRAHSVGAHVVLDTYQSAGAIPLEYEKWGISFGVGGSVKWLCGGPGAGWLYARPDLAEQLEPSLTGWQAHARPFGFEPEMDYAPGAARFLTGTPNVPALYAATAGYDLIEEVGVDRIREHSMRQTALLAELLGAAGFELTGPLDPERRGGTVTVRTPGFEAVHGELAAREILCDFRPDSGLRLGPHFFTTDDELRFTVEQIIDIVEAGVVQWAGAATY